MAGYEDLWSEFRARSWALCLERSLTVLARIIFIVAQADTITLQTLMQACRLPIALLGQLVQVLLMLCSVPPSLTLLVTLLSIVKVWIRFRSHKLYSRGPISLYDTEQLHFDTSLGRILIRIWYLHSSTTFSVYCIRFNPKQAAAKRHCWGSKIMIGIHFNYHRQCAWCFGVPVTIELSWSELISDLAW